MKAKYTRLFSGPDGESHFKDVEIEFKELNFAPPAPPISVSPFVPAAQCGFISVPPGWYGDWHPAPRRQYLFQLEGKMEVKTSDGDVRTLEPGDIVLMEDTVGKGHASRVVGSTAAVYAVAQLSD